MRRALGITPSTLLELTLVDDTIVVTRIPRASERDIRIYTDEEIAEFLEEDKLSPADAEWVREMLGAKLL
jgi:hypothetical protein